MFEHSAGMTIDLGGSARDELESLFNAEKRHLEKAIRKSGQDYRQNTCADKA
jgi:hypothetical protein